MQQTLKEEMAFLFFSPVRFLFERLKDGLSSLTAAFGQNYAPRTIIGTDHKWVHHHQLKQSQPIIRKVHGKAVPVTFGPLYRDLDILKREKEAAWNYILRNSDDVGGEIETNDIYIKAVRGIEVESRAMYGDGTGNDPITSLTSDEFIWIMIFDGCFLLQVALLVLGGRKQLGNPLDDPIFGQPGNKDLIRAAMSSMFIVGNQMPILVLKELMKQSFFKKVFNQGIWNQPPDLERWVLFELLLVPMLDMRGGAISIPTSLMPIYELRKVPSLPRKHFIAIMKSAVESLSMKRSIELIFEIMFQIWFKWRSPSRKAHDLLHGLWLLMTGLAYSKENEDHIESNCNHHYDVVSSTVRSATELDKAGIGLKDNKGTNISGISFETFMFNAFLILPQIVIDSQIETLFCNLIQYENTQDLGETKQKICAYLQLMRELIRTPEDAKLLASNGVIIVDPSQEETLPKLFEGLPIPRVKTDRSLEVVRVELNKHTYLATMFKKLSNVLSIVICLALVQTVYVILTYHQKR